ncbi:MAG: hypothetical protein N2110_02735 [Flavobacteriales bacterium]|nr:hypothetical protein [Flavobacteriales bacterium]MCX7767922.1 hypothetical protein [Flavobacteriales bacterium]MDW8409326.1 hypothetical protein [Flavobacteriales bacterium]
MMRPPWQALAHGFFLWTGVHAQYGVFSPYSRLGLGLPYHDVVAPAGFLGPASVAARQGALLNPANPASYSALEHLMLQFGMEAQQYRQFRGDASQNGNHAFFSQFALALPLWSQKMTLAVGFLPYTGTRYSYQSENQLVSPDDTFLVRHFYEGHGGVDRFFLGWSVKFLKGLSLGLNGLVYLGQIQKDKITHYPDVTGFIQTRFRESQRIRGPGLEAGIQYEITWRKVLVTLGAAGEYGFGARSLETRQTDYYYGNYGDNPLFSELVSDRRVTVRRPSALRGGFSCGKPGQWMIFAGVDHTFWAAYRYDGIPEPLFGNRSARALAAEFLPFRKSLKSPGAFTSIQVSFRYTTEALRPEGQPFRTFGIGFGLSIPWLTNSLMDRKLTSWLNAGVDYSLTRHPSPAVTGSDVFRLILAVNLRDKWSPKFKYN